MATKTITYPPLVVMSGNETMLRVLVSDAYKVLGTAQTGYLWLKSYSHIAGDIISFTWNGNQVTFTCVDTYTGAPNTYPKRTTETIDIWGNTVFTCIFSNNALATDFLIKGYPQGTNYLITFEPYMKISGMNLVISVTSSAPVETRTSSFTPDELFESYKLKIQLLQKVAEVNVDGFVNTRSPVHVPFIYNALNASLDYDLKRIIYTDLTGHFTFPESGVRHIHDIIKKYYLQLTFLCDNMTTESLPPDNFIHVLPGKMSDTKEKALNTSESSIYADLISTKRFLSYAPQAKDTDVYAPEKLYFLFLAAYPTAKLRITERFTNSAAETRDLDTFEAAAFSLHEFSVGFQTIKQADYGSKILYEYEIWIENGSGGLVSEHRTFRMDYAYQRMARYFYFQNSFGVYELFRSTGDAVKINKIDKSFYSRVVHGKKDRDQTRKPIEILQDYGMKVNSGYLEDPLNFYYASEFLGSGDVYWLKNDRAYAVQIESSDTEISRTDLDNLHDFDFMVSIDDMDDTFYQEFLPGSELPVLGDFSNDFSDDFNV